MLRDLSRASEAWVAQPTAIASESLIANPAQQPGGFADHSAVLDAATHTAALFAAAKADEAAVTRVPAAVDAFWSGSRTGPQHRSGWCVGSMEAVLPSQTVITSFGLASGHGTTPAGARLCGFQAKVMSASPAAAAAATAEPSLHYCMQWQAQQAAGHDSFEGPTGARQGAGVHWVRSDAAAPVLRIYRMPTDEATARPAHDAAHSLALLQTVMRDAAPSTALQLVTRGALSFPDVCSSPGAAHAASCPTRRLK